MLIFELQLLSFIKDFCSNQAHATFLFIPYKFCCDQSIRILENDMEVLRQV